MAYQPLDCLGTQFAVDWDVIRRFTKSYWRAYYQGYFSETIDLSESEWYNPLSWSMPTIHTLEVQWDKVREAAESVCDRDMVIYQRSARTDMRGVALDVESRLKQIAVMRKRFNDELKDIQSRNAASIAEAVDDYTGFIDAARFIRDTSADIVAIGSTIATGGAAAGLLGASSALKGIYKYQDTSSVGASLIYGGGSLVLGLFKVGGKKVVGDYTLIVLQGALEAGTSWASGETFLKAAEKGALKIATAAGSQAIFGSKPVKAALERTGLPFNVWSVTSRSGIEYMATDVGGDLLAGGTKKLAEKTSKKVIEGYLKDTVETPRTSSVGVADEVPLEQTLLLKLAIVNMNKGIGHGW